MQKHPIFYFALGACLALSACGGGSSNSGSDTTPTLPPANQPRAADTVRFLQQSSFGPTEALVSEVQQKGFTQYLNEQFAAKGIGYENLPGAIDPVIIAGVKPVTCTDDGNRLSAASQCNRDNFSLFPVQTRFFKNALTEPDQLRQRVAWALSQILVVSGTEIFRSYSMQGYQRILHENAFGNYRDILYKITLSPAMGRYLDMVNNNKPSATFQPNENYARELLQLFSIGQVKLKIDGSPVLENDKPVPTYSQDDVEGFAHVFTGWTYPTMPGATAKFFNPEYYVGDMALIANRHDTNPKQLLDGVVLPANQTPEKDLNDAIDNIFNHPNVGPFIGKLLIQHLVTSNPSPAYIERVATAFNNNGQGVRGDMKAVVRTILLDPEARGDSKTDPNYGHLKEPALYNLNMLRAMNAKTDGVVMRYFNQIMGQEVFDAPSVFNYYPPDHVMASENINAPEFAIQNSSTAINRANFANTLMFNRPAYYDTAQKKYVNPLPEAVSGIYFDEAVSGSVGTLIDWAPWATLAADSNALIDKINSLMFHGAMSAGMKDSINQALAAVDAGNNLLRARTAVYLAATSTQYQVER
jgi:uncharacterized protein (DUF1800 family)